MIHFWANVFFQHFDYYQVLDIVILDYMQNRQKRMYFVQDNGLKPLFCHFLALNGPVFGRNIFFTKIWKGHFSRFTSSLLDAENQKKIMAGSMRTFIADWLTDRQTTGLDYQGLLRVLKIQLLIRWRHMSPWHHQKSNRRKMLMHSGAFLPPDPTALFHKEDHEIQQAI